MKLYFSNWPLYFSWRKGAKAYWYPKLDFKGKVIFQIGYFDIFINMVLGGDPRETISSSIQKDRKSSWFAGFLINIIEIVDPDHGETAYQPDFGEGSDDNRELPDTARVFVILVWAAILVITGASIYRYMVT